jgi:hypothetical protein
MRPRAARSVAVFREESDCKVGLQEVLGPGKILSRVSCSGVGRECCKLCTL